MTTGQTTFPWADIVRLNCLRFHDMNTYIKYTYLTKRQLQSGIDFSHDAHTLVFGYTRLDANVFREIAFLELWSAVVVEKKRISRWVVSRISQHPTKLRNSNPSARSQRTRKTRIYEDERA
jgi:hypothetical protein